MSLSLWNKVQNNVWDIENDYNPTMFVVKDVRLSITLRESLEEVFWLNIRSAKALDFVLVAINLSKLYNGGSP